jgi:DNA-directed RNA polymerase specialized sigma24 family protein
LEKARRRLAAMRKRLAAIRMEATNNQVAEIMGLSKGTVDASLHNVKRKYNGLLSTKEESSKGNL